MPPARIPSSSSAFASATPSIEPSCSRWTGPRLVITPTSGSQIAVSSAIWPKPRIASSSTSTSVPDGAASTSSGSPISVLKFSREAATLRCGAIIAAIRSLVEVLPTEPVTAITCAARSCRQARASAPSAGTGVSDAITAPALRSSASSSSTHCGWTTTPHAPASSATVANAPPSTFSPGMPKKRSPGWTARESITARPGPPASRPPAGSRTSSAPAVPATRWALQCFTRAPGRLQRLAGHGDVVERLLAPALELLALLVALAGDHDDVAGPRERDGARDRRAAVDLALDVPAARPGRDRLDDRLRVLRARVVGGHDRQVGEPRPDLPHQRALAGVAVAARAEDDDHAALGDRARRQQDVLERARLVRVVDDDGERLALVDRLEAPGHARRVGERGQQRLRRGAEHARRRPRAERVEDVEAPGQPEPHRPLAVGRAQREVRARGVGAHVERAHVGRPRRSRTSPCRGTRRPAGARRGRRRTRSAPPGRSRRACAWPGSSSPCRGGSRGGPGSGS